MTSTPIIFLENWTTISWLDFIVITQLHDYEHASFYYAQGKAKIEMSPVGFSHSRQNGIISNLINLFATLKNIPIIGLINASFRQEKLWEFQPDLAFYLGEGLQIPTPSNSAIDLSIYSLPTLVVEISATTLGDDLGEKRLLYEKVGIREYWVIDVNTERVIAFSMANGRSREILVSEVLSGLSMVIVEEVLRRSNFEDDGKINRWLIKSFS